MCVIAAHQPVELAAERLAVEAQLLREGLELAAALRAEIEDVGQAVIGIGRLGVVIVAIGGDRRQLDAAQVPVDLARKTPVLGLAGIGAVGAGRDAARIGVVVAREILREGRARDPGQHRRHRRARCDQPGIGRRDIGIGLRHVGGRIDGGAAILLAIAIVADQPDGEIGARLEQQLAADEIAVAIVDVPPGIHIVIEAVALRIEPVEAERDLLGERPRHRALQAPRVVIAIGRLGHAAKGELRPLGGDAEHAGRGVAPAQRALRPAQHFDALDLAQIVQAQAGARAVDAVDEGRDVGLLTRAARRRGCGRKCWHRCRSRRRAARGRPG